MSYYPILQKYNGLDFQNIFDTTTDSDIERAISAESITELALLHLLSIKAASKIESIAERSKELTTQYFGKTISLYTPIYLSNYCTNKCPYCGFNASSKIERKQLTEIELEREAEFISDQGFQHVIILTGESKQIAPLSYIESCVKILKKRFSSISIEIYPLTETEYKRLIDLGVDGLTLYQEVYNQSIYKNLHQGGAKENYLFRLNAPERALSQGMRTVSIGALLGLNNWRKEVFFAATHARYLQDKFSSSEISISTPRIQPQVNQFKPEVIVSNRDLVQIITALRIFLPRVGINLSTRESRALRDNLIRLGVTKISAQSSTAVGGHTASKNTSSPQFETADKRSLKEIKDHLLNCGYQPVFKDWVSF